MGLSDYKINSFSKPVSALDDTPQMSAAELKEWFDSNSANELKNSVNGIIEELKDVDVSKQHTHNNKDILDKIKEAPIYNAPSDGKLYARKDGAWSEFGDIPSISTDELDTFTDGVCRVKGDTYFDGESFDKNSVYTIDSENYALCTAYCEYEGDNWDYYQMLIFGNGTMYTRHKNDHYPWDENDENYGNMVYGEWGAWKPVKPLATYNADRAVAAQKDNKGNIIADTYATKDELMGYAVKSERDLIDSSSIRLYGVKNNQDVFEAPRSNTSSSEANENADRNVTGYDRFLNEDVYIYQGTIMRRDDNGRCSILSPIYPKHIANKQYVDDIIQQAVLDSWEAKV